MDREVVKSLQHEMWWCGEIRKNEEWMRMLESSSKTHHHYGEPLDVATCNKRFEDVIVTGETTWAAAKRLHAEHPNAKIVLHNFADVKMPGGYFMKRNDGAQEESLCCVSGLWVLLRVLRDTYPDCYGAVERRSHAFLNEQFAPVLYHHGVPTASEHGSTANGFQCDYVTCAMLDLKHASRSESYLKNMHDRVESVLASVLMNAEGETYFVSGAWGCGVFRNDPEEVFGDYDDVLRKAAANPKGDVHLVMAIPAGHNNTMCHAKLEGWQA